jgi:prevent-host-death family protein
MLTVGAYEAKTHLPKLLERVMNGERITITRHGVPVAVLQPPNAGMNKKPAQVIAALRRFRRNDGPDHFSVCELIKRGRR